MAALGGLIAAAPLVGAQSSTPDRSPHLLLVPDTPRADAALDASSARTVARYDAFTLVEARGEDDADLRGAGADRRDDMRRVSLPGGNVDPLRGRDSLAAKGVADPDETLAVVQFAGPVKDGWLARLRSSGVRIVQYVPQNAYLVHASGAEVDRLAGLVGTLPALRAVTRVTGSDKQGRGVPDPGSDRLVAVQTLAGADGDEARRAVAAAGLPARAGSNVGGLRTQFVELSGTEVDALAADPAVVSVTPYSMPQLLDERSAQIVAGNLSPSGQPSLTPTDYLTWLADKELTEPLSFAIDFTDTGLDTGSVTAPGHRDFYVGGVAAPGASRIAYMHEWTADPTANDCSGHGTNVASIAAGFGADTEPQAKDGGGFRYGLGAAPRALVGASKIFRCDGTFQLPDAFPASERTGLTLLADEAYEDGALISNNSWGNGDLGRYNADSREFDFIVRDARPGVTGNQEMVEVVAAGNDGDGNPGAANEGWASIASPGTAKNVITVGASENTRPLGQITCGVDDGGANQPGDIIGFSSRGPTNDGRMKPDVVAPGTRLVGAAPQNGGQYQGYGVCTKFFVAPFYSLESGTSQAAPAVSGAAALIRAWYTRNQGAPPSPAMTKAILVESATDLAGGDNGKGDTITAAPSADQGWGRAHLGGALDDTRRVYVDQPSAQLDDSGERFGRTYEVDDPDKPLNVTLAWTDPPAAVDANPALVNDLDLVVRQGGRTYKGNVLNGGRSITGGDADRRNNLESVALPDGTGRFSVEVLGTNIAGDGVPGDGDATDQDFALVVSNAEAQSNPVLAPDQVQLSDNAPGGDDDDYLEPDEPFQLAVSLRNGGDSAATGVSGSISGPGLNFIPDSVPWSNIVPGAVVAGNAPFAGKLAPGAACGTNVPATLELATGQGPATVPITIPTGEPGVPQTNASASPPLAIPDESSVGVTSTIGVNTPGRIKDLNVTIGNITHGWVGDLVIELTSPEGTTVRLVQHPGGPDNDGNNLINTTFDDDVPTNISAGNAPYSGSFKPQNDQLSRFDGEQRQGTWTLRVRDLFEGDPGTLTSWQLTSSRAICDFTDQLPPDTSISGGPSGLTASNSASFNLAANEPNPTFECSLDGAATGACDASFALSGLSDGPHTLRVQARDTADNLDPTPAERSWTVDTAAPAISMSSPRSGATVRDSRPQLAGSAGTAPGDSESVVVKLWRGTLTGGLPAQTLTVARNANAWSTRPAALGDGTWTARVEQMDAAGNVGVSPSTTFSVGAVAEPAPEFAIVPSESDLSDARRNKLTVLAGCGAACRVTAELRSRSRRPQLLARGSTSLGAGRSKAFTVNLTRTGRLALRRVSAYKATLQVTVDGAAEPLKVKGLLALREIDVGRVAQRGLRFAGKCSRPCSVAANLLMSPSEARHHGLRAPGRESVPVAGATSRLSTSSKLVLRLRKSSRQPLLKARRVKVTMEARVRASTGPSHRASYRLTLRR